jgi:hypothetical protein
MTPKTALAVEAETPCQHFNRRDVGKPDSGRQVCDNCKQIFMGNIPVTVIPPVAVVPEEPTSQKTAKTKEYPAAALRRINAERGQKSKAATEKQDPLAVNKKGDIMSVIHSLSDKALVSHITSAVNTFIEDTDKRFRTFSIDLQPYALEFMNRFKAEKKAGRHYLGFKDFDRACGTILHYSSKQVRRIAIGQPTPPKPTVKHETEEEKASREAKQQLNARIDLEARLLREEREASNQESASLINETVGAYAVPVVVVPSEKEKQELKEFREIASHNVKALEIADEILPLLYHVSDRSQHSQIKEYMRLRNIPVSAIPVLAKNASAA